MKDLVVLVADSHSRSTFLTLLTRRRRSLHIRSLTFDVHAHPHKDAGVFRQASKFLREFRRTHAHAIVALDCEFAGSPGTRSDLEGQIQRELDASGWEDRACVVAMDPEIEQWLWCAPHHLLELLGSSEHEARSVATTSGWLNSATSGFSRPKELLHELARRHREPISARIFARLAERISLERCSDPAFAKLRHSLVGWFGTSNAGGAA